MPINIPHQTIVIDVNSRIEQRIQCLANLNYNVTRFVDVKLTANGTELNLSDCTATAAVVTDGVLINDAIECAVDSDNSLITIPVEEFNIKAGIAKVELKVNAQENEVLNTPIAFQIRVTPSIIDSAEICEKSVGTVAGVIKEVAAAKGTYANLSSRFAAAESSITAKADKSTTLAGYGITDAYNKAQTDTKLSLKINTNKIATEITASTDKTKLPNIAALTAYLNGKYYDKNSTYSFEEVDNLLDEKANVCANANILKIPNFTETKNGVTLTASKNHITINGKTTANSTFRIILASPYLPINGTYTFSAQNAENNAHGSVTLYSGSASSTNITSAISFENDSSTTFTADNTIRQIWIWLPQNTNFVNQQFDLQLEEGNTKTVFNLPITLDEDLQSGCVSQRHLDDTLRNKIFGDKRILSKLISDAGFAGLIKSYCCIGDSLTEGFFDITNGAQRDFEPSDFCSYPQQLKRITGANVLNYGISGSTAKPSDNSRSWLKQATAKGWLTSEDKSVGYIIALGVNDLILYDEFSGDVTTDINSADYTQNAKTSVGGYAAIIQKIKSLQPDAKIFCVTLPNDRGAAEIRTATNEKIKAIANLLGCYVIDLQNEWFSEEEKDDFCAKYRNGGHWNAMGYNQLAKAYVTYIDYIISYNFDDFRNIQFVGTEMQYNS